MKPATNQLGLWEPVRPTIAAPSKPAFFDPANPYGLRHYQRELKDAVEQALSENRSALVVAATGTGKTMSFAAIAGDWKGRVLVLAHRDELISQTIETLERITAERIGREQAEDRSTGERIVVGSVQTCHRDNRLKHLATRGEFDLVVIDEAHHSPSKSYRKVIGAFENAKILGVTATPDRGDEQALGKIFETVAYTYGIEDAIPDGWLVPIEGRRLHLDSIDVSEVEVSAGDLQVGQLDEVMLRAVEGIAQTTLREFPDKPGIVFCPGKRSALYACERLNAIKPGCAATIVEDTPKHERQAIMRGVRRGDTQWFVNCLVATEGTDIPLAEVIVCARPTKSRALFTQMVGRGTRPLPGILDGLDGAENAERRRQAIAASAKTRCIVADLVGNSGRHSLASVEDVLGGHYDEDVVERAKKNAAKDGGGDPIDHLKRAQAEINRQREQREMAARAKLIKGSAQYRVERYDPFSLAGIKGGLERDHVLSKRYGQRMMTDGQKKFLGSLGFDVSKMSDVSMRGASKLIEATRDRRGKGLCTIKQLNALRSRGVDGDVSFSGARAAMDYLSRHNWGRDATFNQAELLRLAKTPNPTKVGP